MHQRPPATSSHLFFFFEILLLFAQRVDMPPCFLMRQTPAPSRARAEFIRFCRGVRVPSACCASGPESHTMPVYFAPMHLRFEIPRHFMTVQILLPRAPFPAHLMRIAVFFLLIFFILSSPYSPTAPPVLRFSRLPFYSYSLILSLARVPRSHGACMARDAPPARHF